MIVLEMSEKTMSIEYIVKGGKKPKKINNFVAA